MMRTDHRIENITRLSDREKQVLQLLATGHDAKSAARLLNLSVHTINERLRDARRVLGVTSSREAARLLIEAEPGDGQEIWPNASGVGSPPQPDDGYEGYRRIWGIRSVTILLIGAFLMSLGALFAVLLGASGSVTSAAAAPMVVVTSPAEGGMIDAGPFVLSVTFDRPMRAGSYSFVRVSAESYPECDSRPAQSQDKRTFSLRCAARSGKVYELWLNRGRFMNFQSASGVIAVPYRLTFRTR